MNTEDTIRRFLDQYIDATARRDLSQMRALFHENASFSGILGGRKIVGSIYPFFDHLAQNEVFSNYRARIVAVSPAHDAAGARIEERNLFGTTFDTFLHMVLFQDLGWQITAKLSQSR